MSIEEVTTNYNEIGLELIEMMYGDGYLSMGGAHSTDALAVQAGITEEMRILDVGSGLGGPALYLAKTYGCRVTGLDLIELSVRNATNRAHGRALDHLVDFQVGDATEMPFEAGCFDVVLGQDAWCHIPDKDRLIGECARVLAREGTVAFTDWIEVGEMDEDYRAEVLSAAACPNLGTLQGYCDLLEKHGFSVARREDISQDFIHRYQEIVVNVRGMERAISEKFSPKIFQIMLQKNSCILRAFEDKKMGGCRLVGNKD